MIKQSGRIEIAVDRIVEVRDTISPGSRESAGLIAFMARAVGCARIAIKMKESVKACFIFTLSPVKLPIPT